MADIEILIGGLVALVIGLLVGYGIGIRRARRAEARVRELEMAGAQMRTRRFEPPPAPMRDPVRAPERPREGAPPPRPSAPPPAAARPQPAPQRPERPNEDRTVMRKLRSAREAFTQSQEHLEAIKDSPEDVNESGGKKPPRS